MPEGDRPAVVLRVFLVVGLAVGENFALVVNVNELRAVLGGLLHRIGVYDARFDFGDALLRLGREFFLTELFAEMLHFVGALLVERRRLIQLLLLRTKRSNRRRRQRAQSRAIARISRIVLRRAARRH